jgi:hypothetical protein
VAGVKKELSPIVTVKAVVPGGGTVGVSFQSTAPKFIPLSDHAPWALKLVPFKNNESQRPWDGAFLGLFTVGWQAEAPMGLCPDCAVL